MGYFIINDYKGVEKIRVIYVSYIVVNIMEF